MATPSPAIRAKQQSDLASALDYALSSAKGADARRETGEEPHSERDAFGPATVLREVLDTEAAALNHAAAELGAGFVSVLFSDGARTEVTYSWNRFGSHAPKHQFFPSHGEFIAVLGKRSGPVEADTPVAQLLRDWMSPHSQSFLILPWRVQRRVVTALFGFDSPAPPYRQVPDWIVKNLGLFALATWSVREIARLRAELRIANTRLAGRKLVERAKGILQRERGLSEEQAYGYMRGNSRKRRITLEELSEEIVGGRALASADKHD